MRTVTYLCLVAAGMTLPYCPRANTDSQKQNKRPPLEQRDELGRVETLPAKPGPHWVWIADASLSAMPDGRAHLFDGDSGRMLGGLNTGYSFVGLTLPSDYSKIYAAETYYSRHTRGKRTDLVSIYDPVNLTPVGEIVIPTKRGSTIPRLANAAISDNDRFVAVYNINPATSLSIVDVTTQKFTLEVPTPGCYMAYAAGERHFFSICGDGTLLLISLNEKGTEAERRRSSPFFEIDEDPILENGVRLGNRWQFVSVRGRVYTVDVSTPEPIFPKPWSMLAAAGIEESANWRPGGQMSLAGHAGTNTLYVLMHQGGFFTYEDPGGVVWRLNTSNQTFEGQIDLVHTTSSILVTQDKIPLLFAIRADEPTLDVYDATTGDHLRTIEQIGATPFLMHTPIH